MLKQCFWVVKIPVEVKMLFLVVQLLEGCGLGIAVYSMVVGGAAWPSCDTSF